MHRIQVYMWILGLKEQNAKNNADLYKAGCKVSLMFNNVTQRHQSKKG